MSPYSKTQRFRSSLNVGIGFVLTGVVLAVFIITAIGQITDQAALNEKLYKHPFTATTHVLEAKTHIVTIHQLMKDAVYGLSVQGLNAVVANIREHDEQVMLHLELAREHTLGNSRAFAATAQELADWRPIREEIITLLGEQQLEEAELIAAEKEANHVSRLTRKVNDLINFDRDMARRFSVKSREESERSIRLMTILSIIGAVSISVTAIVVFFRVARAERSSSINARRYKMLFDNADVAIWSVDFSKAIRDLDALRNQGITDLRTHLKKNPIAAVELANSLTINGSNKSSLELFEMKSGNAFLGPITDTFGEGAINVFIDSMCAIWDDEKAFQSEVQLRTNNGNEIYGILSFPIPERHDDNTAIPIAITDITHRKFAEMEQALNASVFKAADEGIMITDPKGTIIDVNDAFCKITGYSRDEIIHKNPRILKSGRQDDMFYRRMWRDLVARGSWRGEIWNRRKDGTEYSEMLTISAVHDDAGEVKNYIGLSSDITRIKQQEDELRYLAQYDALTSLPNRVLLSDRLRLAMAQTLRREINLAVAFIDLDGFKAINDTYGHDIGDELLVAAATRMEGLMRDGDTLARIGGDEFVAILTDLSEPSDVSPVLNRLLSAVAKQFEINGTTLSVSASIGVTFFPQSKDIAADQLQRQADQAMYEAKLAGRNCCRFFNADHDIAVSSQYAMIAEIERALTESEFALYYQPKVNMHTGEVIGVEALIRWNHPERGLLGPGYFLPNIEEHAISIDLGEWVIGAALAQIDSWQCEGLNIPISVNIGAMQIQQANFIDRLKAKLADHPNVRPEMLELEILETSALHDLERVADLILECRQLGISFALDDFGSGYSSLIYLKRLPVGVLKIDQAFVRTMLHNPDDEIILNGVIMLAENFHLKALAEGVETEAHGELLLKLGCQLGQGYAISEPLPASEFPIWLKNWKPAASWKNIPQSR